jgi:predicted MFS family arabinose efflux permease
MGFFQLQAAGPVRSWVILVALALGVCVSNGYARFAYGLILPEMRADLEWSYTQAGWINTANAIGYVIGAWVTLVLISRVPAAWLFAVGMVATSVFLLLSGLTQDFWMLTFWRVFTGIAGAPAFISGGALAASLFQDNPRKNALAIAVYFGGGGLGMVLSGAVLPVMFDMQGASAWPLAWALLGGSSLLFCPLAIWAAFSLRVPPRNKAAKVPLPIHAMRFQLWGYVFYATGYIVYLTFLVAWMRALDVGTFMVSLVWIITGLGIIVSPFVWRVVLAKYRSGVPLGLAVGAVGLGTFLPVVMPTNVGLIASAAIFGVSIFIGPAAVTSFSRQNLPQASWGRSVSLFTLLFAVGQTIGPVAAGMIGDVFGGIDYGLIGAGVILLAGAGIAFLQAPLEAQDIKHEPA